MLHDLRDIAVERVKRPGTLFAAMLCAIGVGIMGNALFLQGHRHPAPLFSHHDLGEAPREQGAIPSPAAREEPGPARPAEVGNPVAAADALIATVQTALARAAYGPLDADGLMGPATRDAIMRFQRDRDLPVTGEVSEGLIVELRAYGALDAE